MSIIPLNYGAGTASMIPCFAAEKTLGRLAKWLRLLGFDTLYEPEMAGERLMERLDADRIVLTRTQRIRKRSAADRLIFIQSDHWEQQVKQVLRELAIALDQTRPYSRCLQCNVPIVAAGKDSLWGRVPDYIFETHESFQQCPECGRVFWSGSHAQRSFEKIRQFFE